jgi:hypothetical protein
MKAEDLNLLGHDAVALGERILTFRKNAMSSFSVLKHIGYTGTTVFRKAKNSAFDGRNSHPILSNTAVRT